MGIELPTSDSFQLSHFLRWSSLFPAAPDDLALKTRLLLSVSCTGNMLDALLLKNGWKGGSERRAEESSGINGKSSSRISTLPAQNLLWCHCYHHCPEDSVNNTCAYVGNVCNHTEMATQAFQWGCSFTQKSLWWSNWPMRTTLENVTDRHSWDTADCSNR